MTNRLQGKTCIITGTGGGIGSAMARVFASHGARVVGCDIDAEKGEATLSSVKDAGGDMISLVADLTRPESCATVADAAIERFGGIDVLVNNAGKVHMEWMENFTPLQWQETIDGELTQVFLMSKAAWPHLAREGGTIVNVASIAAWTTNPALGGIAHCAAKGGVVAMTRQLAMEGRKVNIRANSLSPGPIGTPTMMEKAGQDATFAELQTRKVMRGTFGRPEEIANVALFLASDESSFVNAADIIADGGATAW